MGAAVRETVARDLVSFSFSSFEVFPDRSNPSLDQTNKRMDVNPRIERTVIMVTVDLPCEKL